MICWTHLLTKTEFGNILIIKEERELASTKVQTRRINVCHATKKYSRQRKHNTPRCCQLKRLVDTSECSFTAGGCVTIMQKWQVEWFGVFDHSAKLTGRIELNSNQVNCRWIKWFHFTFFAVYICYWTVFTKRGNKIYDKAYFGLLSPYLFLFCWM